MTQRSRLPLSAAEVMSRIRAELETPPPSESPVARRMAKIHALQRAFRNDPVGGRLSRLKRAVYWFTASAFDRQAKVVEALIEVVENLGRENERLARQIVRTVDGTVPKRLPPEDDPGQAED